MKTRLAAVLGDEYANEIWAGTLPLGMRKIAPQIR